ncbi:hypothetical protein [Enterococcus columbae]|nr:hypothetical protein [Enterococcus columbae]OJG23751.1 hypothetical protein RR47_GL000466 [Enterococcus columbae DSM 7374 = ATCC 51263]
MDKKVKLTLVAVGVVGLLGVGGYAYNQKIEHDRYEANVNAAIEKIDHEVKQAAVIKVAANQNADNEASIVNQAKLNELKKLQKDLKAYKNGKEAYKPVINKYKEEIKALQKYFKDINQVAVDKLTTTKESLDKNNDKAKLQDSSKQLDTINNTVKSEINVVYSTKEAKTIQDKIATMQKLYQDRIKAIEAKEKADAEAKAKAEAAAKAKAETGNDAAVGYNAQGQAVDAGGNVVQNYNQSGSGSNNSGSSSAGYAGGSYSGGSSSGNYSGGTSGGTSSSGSTTNSEVHPPEGWTVHRVQNENPDAAHASYTTEDENGLHAWDGYGNDLGGGISFGN